MNKIRTLLVDDEPRGLSALKMLLEFHCPEAEIVGMSGDANDAVQKIRTLKPELVFLDIAMPEKNGFDLLREIQPVDFEIIFVTAHSDFMLQAFRFSAVDYLLKPVEDNLLVDAVKRASKRIEEKAGGDRLDTLLYNLRNPESGQKQKICISSLKGFQVVKVSDIIYCEASSNYTNFYFADRPLICASRPMHEFEELLADSNFLRVHKSILINLEHVKEYLRGDGGLILLSNGTKVDVSRRRKDLFLARMKEYYKH